MQIVLFPERSQLRHHGTGMMRIDSCLITPAVDQQDGFRVIQWLKILITQIAFLFTDGSSNSRRLHLLCECSGRAIGSSVIKIDCDHLCILLFNRDIPALVYPISPFDFNAFMV